ncbi:phosphodiesterase [Limobrevibacterium gyesilva]|uniref:Phosphodiesterase n=1 Tax=Limobrevibacterium gyesilva TaxID=2991712 RepID=A0AA41YQV9_9PROT|nr:phosphodiesterase [Limobrevibacterium gyesilva]MCW3477195.1 phosphodiesterase [Limobrevibacterium gyesilva]
MILAQLTDLHCVAHGRPAMGRCETNMLTERALRAVRAFRPRPDAIVITGDLTDNGLQAEYEEVAAILARTAEAPVYVIPGNHDRREGVKAHLAHLPGVSDHPTFVQYTVENLPVRLVMLDTVVPGVGHGELCADRLAWLDTTLAEQPDRPTLIGMHHPPFTCGIRHMDRINLRDSAAFTAVIAKHRQVQRIISGHHHRPINVPVAHAIASIAPSVAHQVELDLFSSAPGQWNLEPAAFQVHVWMEEVGAIVSHTAYVENFAGPFPFLADPEYPGKA